MDDHIDALPPGYRIREYQILRVLGTGGFGITYLAHDTSLDRDVAIKECYPRLYAARTKDHSIRPRSTETSEEYAWALDSFQKEAQTLAHCDVEHPNIVRVHAHLEHHGTGHIVMEYVEGETLHDRLKREGKLNGADLIAILNPLAQGLEQVHKAGILHRDITPKNILLKKDGAPMLVDFGSARQMVDARSGSVTRLATSGYAAPEQCSGGKQGAWTDIYGLSALAYRCITGTVPIDALVRKQADELVPASRAGRGSYPEGLLKVVDLGLSLESSERPQDPRAWRAVCTKASAEAAKRCRLAAEKGDARAQFFFGGMHYHGRDVSEDRAEAMKWYRLAAEQKDSHAQTIVGFMYENGQGVTQDDAEAVKWYRLAAEQGNGYAQYALGLGQLHRLIASADAAKRGDDVTRGSVERYLTDFSAGLATDELRLLSRAFTAQNFLWTDDRSMDLPSGLDKDNPAQVGVVLADLKKRVAADPVLTNKWHMHDKMLEHMRNEIIAHGVLPEEPIKRIRKNKYYAMSEVAYWYRLVTGQSVGQAQDDLRFLRLRLLAELGSASAQFKLGFIYGELEGAARDDAEAVKWFRLAAEQGNANAQYGLGVMYSEGRGVTLDDTEAVKWLRLSAEQGNATAQGDLGIMYAQSRGVTPNDVEAVKWLRQAAEQDNANAQWYLGFMYSEGRGVPQDDVEAVKWLRLAAEHQQKSAQWYLGFMHSQGRGVGQDDAEAVKWFRLAAEQAYASAQHALGIMYEQGRGVKRNEAKAVKWYRRAAEQGYANAQYALGFMYAGARGLPQNDSATTDTEAVKWYRSAADAGNPDAQYALGFMYVEGRGVALDNAEAEKWCRLAAEQGHADAQYNLGFMYARGLGVSPQDEAKSVEWYRRAAEHGNALAQYDLGKMYERGYGLAKDSTKAMMWYRKAAEQGNAVAQYDLAVRYAEGRGVSQDDDTAVRWCQLAAEHGNAYARCNLGFMYAKGLRVAQDDDAAVEWYRQAAEQGHFEAQCNLGFMYAKGRGVPEDEAEAMRWYRLAAGEIVGFERNHFGAMYERGRYPDAISSCRTEQHGSRATPMHNTTLG